MGFLTRNIEASETDRKRRGFLFLVEVELLVSQSCSGKQIFFKNKDDSTASLCPLPPFLSRPGFDPPLPANHVELGIEMQSSFPAHRHNRVSGSESCPFFFLSHLFSTATQQGKGETLDPTRHHPNSQTRSPTTSLPLVHSRADGGRGVTKHLQKHFLCTIDGPLSSYSCFEIHIC